MTTSEMIKDICSQRNMTLSELARSLGQSRQNLYKKLKNCTLSHDELNRIADILGLEYNQIFTLPGGRQLEVVVDGDKESLQTIALKTGLGIVFEALALIDPFTDTVKILHHSGQTHVPVDCVTLDGIGGFRETLLSAVHEDDREELSQLLRGETLRSEFSADKERDLRFRIITDKNCLHKQLKLMRVDEGSHGGSFEILAALSSREEEHLRELSEIEKTENRIRLSKAINDCTAALIGSDDVDASIGNILEIFCNYYQGDRAFIFCFNDDGKTIDLSYEFTAPGVTGRIKEGQNLPIELFRPGIEAMRRENVFYASRTDPAANMTPEKYKAIDVQRIDGLILAPTRDNGEITGFWGVENPNVNIGDLSLVESSAFLISEALFKKKKLTMVQSEREQLRASEKNHQIIDVLASEYTSVYYIDLTNGELTPYAMNEVTEDRFGVLFKNMSYSDAFRLYVETMVIPDDRARMLKAGAVGNIMAELRNKKTFVTTYLSDISGNPRYCEMKFVKVGAETGTPKAVALGFADKDQELRNKIEGEEASRKSNEIIKVLASEYSSVYYVDLLTQEVEVYSLDEPTRLRLGSLFSSGVHYSELLKKCVDVIVYPEDRASLLTSASIYNIIDELSDKKTFTVNFRSNTKGSPHYCEMKFVKVGEEATPQAVTIAFADRDEEYRKKLKEEQMLAKRLRLAETMNKCNELLLITNDIDQSIRSVLELLCGYYDGKRAYVYQQNEPEGLLLCNYEYTTKGTAPVGRVIPYDEEVSALFQTLALNGTLFLSSSDTALSDLGKMLLSREKTDSILLVPTYHHGSVNGFWGVDDPETYTEDFSLIQSIDLIINMGLAKQKEMKAIELYEHDQMTGLYGWKSFKNRGMQLIEENRKKGISSLLLFADMDNLKQINDQFGHDEGDRSLCGMAEIMRNAADGRGLAGRLGGDEFAAAIGLSGEIDSEEAFLAMLQKMIGKYNNNSGLPFEISASFGSTVILPEDGRSFDELLAFTDDKMYHKKSQRSRLISRPYSSRPYSYN